MQLRHAIRTATGCLPVAAYWELRQRAQRWKLRSRDPTKPSPAFAGMVCSIAAILGESKRPAPLELAELHPFPLLPTVYCHCLLYSRSKCVEDATSRRELSYNSKALSSFDSRM